MTGSAPGRGSVEIVRHGERSVVTRAFANSPLRLLTPRNHGRGAWIYTATYGGGLVGGDAIHVDVRLGSDAVAMLSTQASTKVYRSPRETSSELHAVVSSGALLAILPDPVVCFASASYRQVQRVHMHPSAGLIVMDWFSSGRRGYGERWQFDSYTSRLEVFQEGRLVICDALTLDAESGSIGARMGRFNALCAIVLIGPSLARATAQLLAHIASLPIEKHAALLVSASPITRSANGCLLRLAGISFEAVSAAAREYLSFVPSLLGDDPWARRL